MDAHIHHDLPGPQVLAADGALLAHGDYHDVRLLAEGREVLGAGVAEGDGGVFAVQHHGGGLAHHKASAHHHGPLAGEGHLIILQDFKARLCRAGRVADGAVGEDPGQRAVGDAVDVLFRGQCGADGAVIELLGQRAEEQTAVDGRVCVDLRDHVQQLLLRGIFGQEELLYLHADLAAAGQDAFLVGKIVRAGTHPHHGQRGGDAPRFQCRAPGGVCFVHGGHHRRAFQDRCHHITPPVV